MIKEMPKMIQQKVTVYSDLAILEELKGEIDLSDSKNSNFKYYRA